MTLLRFRRTGKSATVTHGAIARLGFCFKTSSSKYSPLNRRCGQMCCSAQSQLTPTLSRSSVHPHAGHNTPNHPLTQFCQTSLHFYNLLFQVFKPVWMFVTELKEGMISAFMPVDARQPRHPQRTNLFQTCSLLPASVYPSLAPITLLIHATHQPIACNPPKLANSKESL